MNLINFDSQNLIFALDIGTRSIIGTVGIVRDKKFNVVAEYYIEHEERAMIDGQIHDINRVANGVKIVKNKLEEKLKMTLNNVSIAAAGRFLRTTEVKSEIDIDNEKVIDKEVIRALELTAVKDAKDKVNNYLEEKLYLVGYSVKSYYLNGYVISNLISHKGEQVGCEIIATFLPRSVIDSLYAVMEKVNLKVTNLTLEPIAAMEAAIPSNLRLLNLALVDVGAGTSDIAISCDDSISAYGMVPIAGDEVTEAVAQAFLVNFNTAERMKKESSYKEEINYVDVLGLENLVLSEQILRVIEPVSKKISKEVGDKIIELNGGKSPKAVFLVGGGAHTPGFKEDLSQVLNLPLQRIAIKGREAVTECVPMDNNLGSIGVTVLGIALVAIRSLGHDFIDVSLNDKIISLFNSHRHTVMDVIMQAGISPKVLMVKNGTNIKFTINDIKRVSFGDLGENATILINNIAKNIDSEVKEGDDIILNFAKQGKEACPKLLDYIENFNSVSFFINDKMKNTEPLGFINNLRVTLQEKIKDGDNVKLLFTKTLGEYVQYFEDYKKDYKYTIEGMNINDDYEIGEEDKIYTIPSLDIDNMVMDNNINLNEAVINKTVLMVKINNKEVELKNKMKYVFIDIFDYIKFDLSYSRGNLVLMINDKKAGYQDVIAEGDNIRVFWDNID